MVDLEQRPGISEDADLLLGELLSVNRASARSGGGIRNGTVETVVRAFVNVRHAIGDAAGPSPFEADFAG
jgi:hypothetical protein